MGRSRTSFVAAFLAAFIAALPVWGGLLAAQEQPVTIRSNVRLVRMLVTAKDAQGRLVGDLRQEDFRVTDNGVPQKVALFERNTSQPLSVAVLVDASGSTLRENRAEVDSVRRFLKTLFGEGNPEDRAALYSFNYEVQALSGFTRKLDSLEARLKELKGTAGTSLYDALFFAARDLEERGGRHVIIVVTDGGDTTSGKSFHQAVEAVQTADTVVYPVLVVPVKGSAGRNTGGENALTLIAQQTGGNLFAAELGPQLDQAFEAILKDLRSQYLIGYYPQNLPRTKDRFHRTAVTTTRPGLRIISRTGYYGEADETAEALPPVRFFTAPVHGQLSQEESSRKHAGRGEVPEAPR